MKIFDISPTISPQLAVFPGDKKFERRQSVCFNDGNNYSLSEIHTTVHLGSHVDAPIHYDLNGSSIDERNLNYYLGPCQVVQVTIENERRILPQHLPNTLQITTSRILFRTNSFPDPNLWTDDFVALSAPLIDYLNEAGVILVGIDTPSIDPAQSKELESHRQIAKYNMANLEGIDLSMVPDGIYELIALPLKIQGGDASPVRAILLQN